MAVNKLPKITVVTPSYNQDKYLEKTILSILGQNYPHLEYIVLDGGSTDNSTRIIQKYADHISYWRSASDGGQASAIAEGFEMACGDILCWINSDDMLLPGTLFYVGRFFAQHPKKQWLIGSSVEIDENDRIIRYKKAFPVSFNVMASVAMGFCQQSCFWRRELYEHVGGLNRDRRFCMDYDLFIRFVNIAKPKWTNRRLGVFRKHSEAKTSQLDSVKQYEDKLIRERWGAEIPRYKARLYWLCMLIWGKLTTKVLKNSVTLTIPEGRTS